MISLSLITGKRGFMSYTKCTFDELNLLDDFLLNAIASDPEIGNDFCRTLISVLLQKDIQDLHVVAQKVIMPPTPGIVAYVWILKPGNLWNFLLEVPEMNYNDGLVFYYFNASGTKGGTPAIKAMLNYLQNSCESNVINILDLLSDYGEIPEDLKEQITDQKDISVLRHWHKLAARSASIEEFRQKIL